MTKDEYIAWKQSRPDDAAQWGRDDCIAADKLIRDRALAGLDRELRARAVHPDVRQYVTLMTRCHYGTIETDDFLQRMNAYPDWI